MKLAGRIKRILWRIVHIARVKTRLLMVGCCYEVMEEQRNMATGSGHFVYSVRIASRGSGSGVGKRD
jgi:hypothetical protein